MWAPRALTSADIPGLVAVQRACYGPFLVESAAVFAQRVRSPVNCSLVLTHDGQVCAYLAAYQTQWGKVTPLHGDFEITAQPDTLYLHDMAVLPAYAGQGMAHALMQALWTHARQAGLSRSALVSVQGSRSYWERQGYAAHALDNAAQRAALASYGDGAHYMRQLLAPW